jgi:hypothetical protein
LFRATASERTSVVMPTGFTPDAAKDRLAEYAKASPDLLIIVPIGNVDYVIDAMTPRHGDQSLLLWDLSAYDEKDEDQLVKEHMGDHDWEQIPRLVEHVSPDKTSDERHQHE